MARTALGCEGRLWLRARSSCTISRAAPCVTQEDLTGRASGLRAVLSPHALRFTTPNSGCESESAVWGRLLLCGDSLNARRERNASERRQAGTVNCKEPNSSLRRVQNIQETAVAG